LWATVFIYAVACALIAAFKREAFSQLLARPHLLWIALGAGITNATFNWGVAIGEVVRVVLLFYLMPIWSALLARWLLGEAITPMTLVRIALALAGAALVLSKPGASLPLPSSLPDFLGIAGGASFALNNVLLRKYAADPAPARALAMFGGGVVLALGVAAVLTAAGRIASPALATNSAWLGALVLAVWFIVGNLTLQYGASRLAASTTSIIMLSEILFASVSAVWLGGETLSGRVFAGGALIMLAAALAALPVSPSSKATPT
jgi:drug/metabolite transporter (DMT)-like permease